MKIRQLYAYELRPAAALVMETYSRMEQPYVANPKEIEDFKRYADEDHLWVESCKNKLFLFGAFDDNDQMCAVGAIDAAGAVTLLYAGLNFQHRGLEAEVLREMEEFATVGRSIAREEIKIPGKWMQYTATAGAPEQSSVTGQQPTPEPSFATEQQTAPGQQSSVTGQQTAPGQQPFAAGSSLRRSSRLRQSSSLRRSRRRTGIRTQATDRTMVSSNIRTQGMDRATASSRIRIWATDRVTVSSPIRTQDMDRGTERVTVSRQHLKKRAVLCCGLCWRS